MDMMQEAVRKLDELFTALSIVGEGGYIYLCDMKVDLSRWSQTAVEYFGLPGEYMENAGAIWEESIHPDDREGYRKSINDIFEGKAGAHDMQYRARAKDGHYVVCTCRGLVLRDEEGKPKYFGGIINNHGLTSYVDTVTGLRSLYGFFEDLETLFWNREPKVLALIGVTGFSALNDIYGYSFGNRILQTLARLLQNTFQNKGCVYRMDGTKFALVSKTLNVEQVMDAYEELRTTMNNGIVVDGHKVNPALAGSTLLIDNFEITDKTVYSCLKYAYYESKNAHMGQMQVYRDAISDKNRQMLEKLSEIRNSVAEGCRGFFLCYQPVMHADSETLKGVEALIRWKNDRYGMVPPIQFIPVLEQDALFPVLGRWILKQAMTDGVQFLKKKPDLLVSVNLSYAQLEEKGFVDTVFNLLNETGFPAQNLCLEITERCRLMDMTLLEEIVSSLRAAGIKIAMDDFGTGFSAIGILRKLSMDMVKIDRSFVIDIEQSKTDQITVSQIAEMASAFGAEVCVEGVETLSMVEHLKHYRVNSFQGYYYSKPIPADEFLKYEGTKK